MKKFFTLGFIILLSIFTLYASEVDAKAKISSDMNIMDIDYEFDPDRIDDMSSNCADFAPTIRIGGYLVLVVKIALPLIIIFKTTLNMLSLVTKGDSGELKKNFKKVMLSLIASAVIFFIPTILNVIFGFVSNYNSNITEDSKICSACIFEPFSDTCKNNAEK